MSSASAEEDAEVIKTSLEVLRLEETVARLARELDEARVHLRWAQLNHRAATVACRRWKGYRGMVDAKRPAKSVPDGSGVEVDPRDESHKGRRWRSHGKASQ